MTFFAFTPNVGDTGRRYALLVTARPDISADWRPVTVYSPLKPTDPVTVDVRSADCGLGCYCGAAIRAEADWLARQPTF